MNNSIIPLNPLCKARANSLFVVLENLALLHKNNCNIVQHRNTCRFLHAAEAAHGDLGVYAEGDPVLMISKSGTTEEMLRLIPFLKNRILK